MDSSARDASTPTPTPIPSHDLSFLSPRKAGSNVNGLTFSALNKKRCKVDVGGGGEQSSRDGNALYSPDTRMDDREKPSISMILGSSAQRKTLSIPKLKKFLRKYGQYPAEHRTLIWRVLLKLPENEKSFAGLAGRGVHDSYEHLYDQYPIRERRVFKRLQGLCSQLAHWNAVCGDVDYIPQMVSE